MTYNGYCAWMMKNCKSFQNYRLTHGRYLLHFLAERACRSCVPNSEVFLVDFVFPGTHVFAPFPNRDDKGRKGPGVNPRR